MRLPPSNAAIPPANAPLLSVCVLSLPERLPMLRELLGAESLGGWRRADPSIEVLALVDDGRRTIGDKRNALSSICRGLYRTFVDDDDVVSKFYVSRLLEAIRWWAERRPAPVEGNAHVSSKWGPPVTMRSFERSDRQIPEVISFGVELRGHEPHPDGKQVIFDLEGDHMDRGDVFVRKPNHLCAWHRAIWSQVPFVSSSYGEDSEWSERACALASWHVHIEEVLYTYRSNPDGVCARRDRGEPIHG